MHSCSRRAVATRCRGRGRKKGRNNSEAIIDDLLSQPALLVFAADGHLAVNLSAYKEFMEMAWPKLPSNPFSAGILLLPYPSCS